MSFMDTLEIIIDVCIKCNRFTVHIFRKCLHFCGKFHKGSHHTQSRLLKAGLGIGPPPPYFILLHIMNGNVCVYLLLYLTLYFLPSVQKCVLSSLVIRGEVRWENSHHHWSQHWYWQRNSQGSGKTRYSACPAVFVSPGLKSLFLAQSH